MNNFINKIISLLSTTSLSAIYSPDLKESEDNIAAIQLLPGADTVDTLSNNLAYDNLSMAILVKGNDDDSNSLGLANEVFSKLHNTLNESFTGGVIIGIKGDRPNYVGRTEKEIIVYNVNFQVQVKLD